MKRLHDKLTYANVVASLALFVALAGGTAFAAKQMLPKNSVGTKQLKNNAVTTAKIKNGAVTGAKINASSLGTVPSAADASHAASADNATSLGGTAASGYIKSGQAAGGALSGSFPNPTLATHAVVSSGGSSSSTVLGTSCTHYAGAEVTIDAPSAGTVTVVGTSWMYLAHTNGVEDSFLVSIDESPTACQPSGEKNSAYTTPKSYPSFEHQYLTLPVIGTFSVSAGSHTYYLNGYKEASSSDSVSFYYAALTATFIPS